MPSSYLSVEGLDQKGAIQFMTILILIVGLIAGTYLVQQRTHPRPKADEWVSSPIETQNYCDQFISKVVCGQKTYDTCKQVCLPGGRAAYDCYPTQDSRVCTGTVYCTQENYRCDFESTPSAVPNTNVGTTGFYATPNR